MADILVFNGTVNGTNGSDVFITVPGLMAFTINAGLGTDRLLANISHLAGVSWEANSIENFTFIGQAEAPFIANFGSAPKTIDFSAVTSLAVGLIRDGNLSNTLIGGPLTFAGFDSSLQDGAIAQSMNFNSGVGTLDRSNGPDVSFGSTQLSGFYTLDGVNSSTIGNAGNNSIAVARGSHDFTGGAGLDTVGIRFETMGATVDQFSILVGPGDRLTINAPSANLPFSVAATSVERVQFVDSQGVTVRTVAYDVEAGENAGAAYRLYQAAFDRTPDNDGLKFWIDRIDAGARLVDVAAGFVSSAEFQSVYGANPTSSEFVGRLYQNVLGRQGEPGGVSFWTSELDSGARTKAQVLAGFAESAENIIGVAPTINDGIVLL